MSNAQAPRVFVLSAETLASANAQREANAQQGWAEWQTKLKVGDEVRIGNGKAVWTIGGLYPLNDPNPTWATVTTQTIRRGIRYDQVKRVHNLSRLVKVS